METTYEHLYADCPPERVSFTKGGRPVIYPPKTLRSPTDADCAFAAGLYEGEGTINYATLNRTSFGLIITQAFAEPLLRIQEWASGTIYFEVDPRRRVQVKRYHLRGDIGVDFARSISPWLSPRKRSMIEGAIASWRSLQLPPRELS